MSKDWRWGSPRSGQDGYAPLRSGGGPVFSSPGIVTGLLLVIGAIFLLEWFLPRGVSNLILEQFAFTPLRLTLGLEARTPIIELIGPIFGHMFLHGGIAHVFFNGIWLLILGTGVARRMNVDFGSANVRLSRNILFLTFYLLTGLVAVLFYYSLQPNSPIPMVGASGAISGLMGAAIRFVVPTQATGVAPGELAPLMSRPVLGATLAFTVINLITALGIGTAGVSIAWEAHLGGYFAGLLLYPIFDRAARRLA